MGNYIYRYPRPMVTVDVVLFSMKDNIPCVLLVQRLNDPYGGCWALPGGFVDMDEDLIDAAYRELLEETGIKAASLYQMCTVGTPKRDLRGRTISVVYSGFQSTDVLPKGASDAKDSRWYPLQKLPKLAFDHQRIIATVIKKWLLCSTSKTFSVSIPELFLEGCRSDLNIANPFDGVC